MDAFETLGLLPRLDLDVCELERRYRDLQRQLHPDKFVHASASEKRASLSKAVSVNEAYRTLRDELKRAEALYVRHGGKSGEHGAPADPELLMEVMELRESLAEARAARELATVEQLAGAVTRKQEGAMSELRAAFVALASGDAAALAHAGRALMRLRYYRRFQDEVTAFEEDFTG